MRRRGRREAGSVTCFRGVDEEGGGGTEGAGGGGNRDRAPGKATETTEVASDVHCTQNLIY